MEDIYNISPSEGPFRFSSWLELPFPVFVAVNQAVPVNYRDCETELRIEILSGAFKVATGNDWAASQEAAKRFSRIQAGEESSLPINRGFKYLYVAQTEVEKVVAELEASEETQYVHVELKPSIIHLTALIPEKLVPSEPFAAFDLSPQTGFFNEEVLPHLQSIFSAYRMAVLPWIRYSIPPVSEALLDRTKVEILDAKNEICGGYFYGFDPKSLAWLENMSVPKEIQKRFDQFMADLQLRQAEDQMTSVYYFYRMRRWTEAVAIAAAVVDNLFKELVFKIASTHVEAEAIWKAYRYQQLFKDIFPQFGLPKLPDTEPILWQEFTKAKEYRGATVHGNYPEPFDWEQQELVKHHLTAFHDVARWLKQQLGYSWELDVYDGDGKRLPPFP